MDDIAEAAKIKPTLLAEKFSSKQAILDSFNHQIDKKIAVVFANATHEETIRDQLFDILMARFDSLLPHKQAIKSILQETVPFDPIASVCGMQAVMRSMGSTLELAGIGASSPAGCLKTNALMAIYLRSFKIWLEDDSADMAKTMACLDGDLAKAESLANMIPQAG